MAEISDFDFGDQVDVETFEQILEMDDDEEGGHEFSKSIVFGFLDQAETTLQKMEESIEKKDLPDLSSLGHFLKGSSATLGFNNIRDECEKIQHYGNKKDETGTTDEADEEKLLRLIEKSVVAATSAYRSVDSLMREFYDRLDA